MADRDGSWGPGALYTQCNRRLQDVLWGSSGACCGALSCMGTIFSQEPEQSAVGKPSSGRREEGKQTAGLSDEDPTFIHLRLVGGKCTATMCISGVTREPLYIRQPVCGEVELWRFGRWKEWQPSVWYPSHISHEGYVGGVHEYTTSEGAMCSSDAHKYCQPVSSELPSDTTYNNRVSASTEAVRARSGHLLVEVHLNRRPAGYMILDTGASGYVIEEHAAKELGLKTFGQLYVSGVTGKVQTRFRKASTLSVGPLTIKDPILMEMPMAGLVRGAPNDVVGILGYDVFRRTTMMVASEQHLEALGSVLPFPSTLTADGNTAQADSPCSPVTPMSSEDEATIISTPPVSSRAVTVQGTASTRKGSTSQAPKVSSESVQHYHLTLLNPGKLDRMALGSHWCWQQIKMIANLPHLEVKLQTPSGSVHNVLFMIDTGAAGTEIMFHARAARELGLLDEKNLKVRYVRGVGGQQTSSMKAYRGDLPWVDFGGIKLTNVRCLYASAGGLDISLYSAGIICVDLLLRQPVIFDYVRSQIGFARLPLVNNSGG